MTSKEIHYIEHKGKTIPAWSCPCGEDKEDRELLVKWNEPEDGIEHSICHESCLKLVEDQDQND